MDSPIEKEEKNKIIYPNFFLNCFELMIAQRNSRLWIRSVIKMSRKGEGSKSSAAKTKAPNPSEDESSNFGEFSAGSSNAGQSASKGPANWEVVYANIQEMRKDKSAPVDSMGCERAHDLAAEPKVI
jgi:hypothetical protein